MLSHFEHNLGNMEAAIDAVRREGERYANSLNSEKVLTNMELTYTMIEEVINHSSSTVESHSKNDELTFF